MGKITRRDRVAPCIPGHMGGRIKYTPKEIEVNPSAPPIFEFFPPEGT